MPSKGVTDLKISVVEYKDITCDGNTSTKIHYVNGSPWHITSEEVVNTLGSLYVGDGGDSDETALDAFGCILNTASMDWSADAYKFVVLLTDATSKLDNNYSIPDFAFVSNKLADSHVYTSVITSTMYFDFYKILSEKTDGVMADIYGDYGTILSNFADNIVKISVDDADDRN